MKARYRLTEDAKADLRRIYTHGVVRFGEAQADAYFQALYDRFELLADNPLIFPSAEDIGANLRKSVCGKETIYYEVVDDHVIILFILGRQDLLKQLRQKP